MHQNTPTEKTTENQQLRAVSGYKNLNRFSVAPMLMGINKPVHILTSISSVRRIVNMVALAAVEAQTQPL